MSWPLLLFKQKLTFTLNPSFFPPFFGGRVHGKDDGTRPHNHVHVMEH
jgi:hypothetical protein